MVKFTVRRDRMLLVNIINTDLSVSNTCVSSDPQNQRYIPPQQVLDGIPINTSSNLNGCGLESIDSTEEIPIHEHNYPGYRRQLLRAQQFFFAALV